MFFTVYCLLVFLFGIGCDDGLLEVKKVQKSRKIKEISSPPFVPSNHLLSHLPTLPTYTSSLPLTCPLFVSPHPLYQKMALEQGNTNSSGAGSSGENVIPWNDAYTRLSQQRQTLQNCSSTSVQQNLSLFNNLLDIAYQLEQASAPHVCLHIFLELDGNDNDTHQNNKQNNNLLTVFSPTVSADTSVRQFALRQLCDSFVLFRHLTNTCPVPFHQTQQQDVPLKPNKLYTIPEHVDSPFQDFRRHVSTQPQPQQQTIPPQPLQQPQPQPLPPQPLQPPPLQPSLHQEQALVVTSTTPHQHQPQYTPPPTSDRPLPSTVPMAFPTWFPSRHALPPPLSTNPQPDTSSRPPFPSEKLLITKESFAVFRGLNSSQAQWLYRALFKEAHIRARSLDRYRQKPNAIPRNLTYAIFTPPWMARLIVCDNLSIYMDSPALQDLRTQRSGVGRKRILLLLAAFYEHEQAFAKHALQFLTAHVITMHIGTISTSRPKGSELLPKHLLPRLINANGNDVDPMVINSNTTVVKNKGRENNENEREGMTRPILPAVVNVGVGELQVPTNDETEMAITATKSAAATAASFHAAGIEPHALASRFNIGFEEQRPNERVAVVPPAASVAVVGRKRARETAGVQEEGETAGQEENQRGESTVEMGGMNEQVSKQARSDDENVIQRGVEEEGDGGDDRCNGAGSTGEEEEVHGEAKEEAENGAREVDDGSYSEVDNTVTTTADDTHQSQPNQQDEIKV